jgi:hypothetical protein
MAVDWREIRHWAGIWSSGLFWLILLPFWLLALVGLIRLFLG